MLEQKFSLELTKNGVQKSVYARQGENNARTLSIALTIAGKVANINGYSIRAYYDDNTYSTITNNGNPVEVEIPGTLCANAGERICELKLFKDDDSTDTITEVCYSPQFAVIVEGTIGAEAESVPAGQAVQYEPLLGTSTVSQSEITSADQFVVYGSDGTTNKTLRKSASDVADTISKKHTHANKTLLDNLSDTYFDGRYYTETETDTLLSGKANTSHSHTKSDISDFAHTHDDRYYTESEVDSRLSGKQDTLTAGTGIDINANVISGDRIYAVDFVSGQSYSNRALVYKDNELYEYNTTGSHTVTDSNFSQYFAKYNPPTMYNIERLNNTRPYKWHFWMQTGNIANTYRLYFADATPSVCTPATFYSTAQDYENTKQVCEVEYRYIEDGVYKYIGLSLVNKSNPSTGVYNIAFTGMIDEDTMVIFEHSGSGDYFVKTEKNIGGAEIFKVFFSTNAARTIMSTDKSASEIYSAMNNGSVIQGYYGSSQEEALPMTTNFYSYTEDDVTTVYCIGLWNELSVDNPPSISQYYCYIAGESTSTSSLSGEYGNVNITKGQLVDIYDTSSTSSAWKSKYTPSELEDMMDEDVGMMYNGITILKSEMLNSKFYFYFLDNYNIEKYEVDASKNISRVTQRILVDDNELSGAITSHNTSANAHSTLFNSKANVNHTHNGNDVSYSTSTVYNDGTVGKAISGKADAIHTHDDRYYTESEVDTKLGAKYTKPTTGIPASDLATGVIPDISTKLDTNQGSVNAGKFMKIGTDGNLTPDTIPAGSYVITGTEPASGNTITLDSTITTADIVASYNSGKEICFKLTNTNEYFNLNKYSVTSVNLRESNAFYPTSAYTSCRADSRYVAFAQFYIGTRLYQTYFASSIDGYYFEKDGSRWKLKRGGIRTAYSYIYSDNDGVTWSDVYGTGVDGINVDGYTNLITYYGSGTSNSFSNYYDTEHSTEHTFYFTNLLNNNGLKARAITVVAQYTYPTASFTDTSIVTDISTKADLVDGKVPASQLPSYVDDVEEYDSLTSFPSTGEQGKIYVTKDTNYTYRWSGTTYVKLTDVDLTSYYTKTETDTLLNAKQNTLTAGTNITIENNVISASGGNDKMNKANPTGTGSFSMNRKSGSVVGSESVALGYNASATASVSYAEGRNTIASGETSHAEGSNTVAHGQYSHSEGHKTEAYHQKAHVEGYCTLAQKVNKAYNGMVQHVEGMNNVPKDAYWYGSSTSTDYVSGTKTYVAPVNDWRHSIYISHKDGGPMTEDAIKLVPNIDYTVSSNKKTLYLSDTGVSKIPSDWEEIRIQSIDDNENAEVFLHIIGNGYTNNNRSNAYAVDFFGNGYYNKDVYVNCEDDSTGGKKLATEEYVNSQKELPASLGTAGQVLKVNSGATGVEWGNAGGGGNNEFILNFEDGDNENEIICDKTLAEIKAADAEGKTIVGYYMFQKMFTTVKELDEDYISLSTISSLAGGHDIYTIVHFIQDDTPAWELIHKDLSGGGGSASSVTYDNTTSGLVATNVQSAIDEQSEKIVNLQSGKEDASNKVTSLSAQSTDTQFPSAKCVYDELNEQYELIEEITLTEAVSVIERTNLNLKSLYIEFERQGDCPNVVEINGLWCFYQGQQGASPSFHSFFYRNICGVFYGTQRADVGPYYNWNADKELYRNGFSHYPASNITQIKFLAINGNFEINTNIKIYGVRA